MHLMVPLSFLGRVAQYLKMLESASKDVLKDQFHTSPSSFGKKNIKSLGYKTTGDNSFKN